MFTCFDTGLGYFPRDAPNRRDFANKQGMQIKAVKGMIDRILEPKEEKDLYDYSPNDNFNDRTSIESYMIDMFNELFYVVPPLIIKMPIVVLVWYPYYREHFGWCWACVFTLFGLVDGVTPWQ